MEGSHLSMMDHLFESGFRVVRIMVDWILADKYTLQEELFKSSARSITKLIRNKESISE